MNKKRLLRRIHEMAQIGATMRGGCNRQALTDEDKAGRDLYVEWCKQAGCRVTVDQMGNIFARREGDNPEMPPVLTGSHLDTQPTGGKFDGVYGVLAGLEVVETLNDQQISTSHPIEIVVWTNEEGARFSPAMIGSGVFASEFSLDFAYERADADGHKISEELARIGYKGSVACKARPIKAAFEAHIEQGPILEDEGIEIGIVTGVQGIRWYDIVITGEPVHAGPTPMDRRRDPVKVASQIISRLYDMTERSGEWARVTIGNISAAPGARNTVPEQVTISVDLRHPDVGVLDEMDKATRELAEKEAFDGNVSVVVKDEWYSPPVRFASTCIDAVGGAVKRLGLSAKEMVSGAGHDSVYLSRVAPTSMIFIPCEGGISHNEAEHADDPSLEAGCNVLLHSILAMAQSSEKN